MIGEKEMDTMFKLMERASELDLRRAKIMRESLKTKDSKMLMEGMADIFRDMEALKTEMNTFVEKHGMPSMEETDIKIDEKEFMKIFSPN